MSAPPINKTPLHESMAKSAAQLLQEAAEAFEEQSRGNGNVTPLLHLQIGPVSGAGNPAHGASGTWDNCQENTDAAPSPSPLPAPLPANEGFTKDQTLFLIDLMQTHIETEGEGPPKTLEDLSARLKSAKASKKQLWEDAAEKLGSHFTQSFCPHKVGRKWTTLVEAYKKLKDNKTTGKGTIRFQFYSEMDDLLVGRRNVVFPVVGTLERLNSESRRNLTNPDIKVNMSAPRIINGCQENPDAASCPSPSSPSAPSMLMPANEGFKFTKDQTLFLIDLMRQHIETEGEGPPKTLEDLNVRLKSAMASKKKLWKDAAEKLSSHFAQSFCPDKVARKWLTLVEAYKKLKDKKTTGNGTIRFKFYSEMDDLLGGQHDVLFPVVGTSERLDSENRRKLTNPDVKTKMSPPRINNGGQENTDAAPSPSPSSPSALPAPLPAHKGFTKDHTLFLIDLMRQHIETEGEGPPKTLKDLNARLKSAMASKKKLWKDAAEKLSSHFTQSFCPDKVARKWLTLVEAYKKLKDKKKRGTIRFQFYSEMDDLLGGQHDVVFPVGTSEGPDSESRSNPNIYLDMNMNMFVDPQRSIPFIGLLYQKAADPNTYYLNEDFTIMVNLVEAGDFHTLTDSCQENPDATSSPSPSSPPSPSLLMSANEGFSMQQTLFLIDLIRQHIESEGRGPPKTRTDRNARLQPTVASKKQLWKDAAEKLGGHFRQSFCPDTVARKWNTLVDAYKTFKDDKTTGKGTVRFQFYSEMDDLLEGRHDVVFPVVGTSEGLEVRRPEALGSCNSVTAFADTASSQSPAADTATPPHKRRRVEDEIMQFLRESEEASRRRHEETIAQLKSAQQGFEALMTKLLDKL